MARQEPRSRSHLRRRRPIREAYDRVLIVCEGSKTEPAYLSELVDRHKLSTANVVVIGSGSDPRALVKRAKTLRQAERRDDRYDRVYCVFDRDQHAQFDSASDEARRDGMQLARSWPCFEFWLVLHFTYRRSPYTRSGARTEAQNCERDLRQHFPHYRKGMAGVFGKLEDRVETAKRHVHRAQSDASATGRDDPSTEVHSLVTYLQSLKAP